MPGDSSSWRSMMFAPFRSTVRCVPRRVTIMRFHSPGGFDMFRDAPAVEMIPPWSWCVIGPSFFEESRICASMPVFTGSAVSPTRKKTPLLPPAG